MLLVYNHPSRNVHHSEPDINSTNKINRDINEILNVRIAKLHLHKLYDIAYCVINKDIEFYTS